MRELRSLGVALCVLLLLLSLLLLLLLLLLRVTLRESLALGHDALESFRLFRNFLIVESDFFAEFSRIRRHLGSAALVSLTMYFFFLFSTRYFDRVSIKLSHHPFASSSTFGLIVADMIFQYILVDDMLSLQSLDQR